MIQLRKKIGIPSQCEHAGLIKAITVEANDKNGEEEVRDLVVVVQLAITGVNDKTFEVEKRYNLAGRGATAFEADFAAWSGRELTEEERFGGFDPDVTMVGKPALVVVKHRKVGAKIVAVIDKILAPKSGSENPVTSGSAAGQP